MGGKVNDGHLVWGGTGLRWRMSLGRYYEGLPVLETEGVVGVNGGVVRLGLVCEDI